jgi:hypothetical protein
MRLSYRVCLKKRTKVYFSFGLRLASPKRSKRIGAALQGVLGFPVKSVYLFAFDVVHALHRLEHRY